MQAKTKVIAQAVAFQLEQILLDYGIVVTASAPAFNLDRAVDRKVYVFTSDRVSLPVTRNLQEVTYSVSIALIDKVGSDEGELDNRLSVLELISDFLIGRNFEIQTDQQTLICDVIGYEHAPLYDRELLETRRIFGGGLIAQIRTAEPLFKE